MRRQEASRSAASGPGSGRMARNASGDGPTTSPQTTVKPSPVSTANVTPPAVWPGVITGALLAFTLSLDDFTISYFTTSPLVQNLSTLIYSEARKGIKPTMNALSAVMFVALLILLLVVNRRSSKDNN